MVKSDGLTVKVEVADAPQVKAAIGVLAADIKMMADWIEDEGYDLAIVFGVDALKRWRRLEPTDG